MSKKLDLDIRGLIRDGKLSDKRMGQLLALDIIESSQDKPNAVLSDADERAIRASGKPEILNQYINGANYVCSKILPNQHISGVTMSRQIRVVENQLDQIKLAYATMYTPPVVIALTEEAYKKEGLKKRERRLKREYDLGVIMAIIIDDIYNNPRSDKEKQAIKDNTTYIKSWDEPNERVNIGYRLIEGKGLTDSEREETSIVDLMLCVPQTEAYIEVVKDRLFSDYKPLLDLLGIKDRDDERITTESYSLKFKGDILEKIKDEGLERQLNTPESSRCFLDEYDDNDKYDMKKDGYSLRRLYEQYDQTYAIIKDTSKFTGSRRGLDDGILYPYEDKIDERLFFPTTGMVKNLLAYRAGYPKGSLCNIDGAIENQPPLKGLRRNIDAIDSMGAVIYLRNKIYKKVGQILGIDKSEQFKEWLDEELMSVYYLLSDYEQVRTTFIMSIIEVYVRPEYQDYHAEVLKSVRSIVGLDYAKELKRLSDEYLKDEPEDKKKEPEEEKPKKALYATEGGGLNVVEDKAIYEANIELSSNIFPLLMIGKEPLGEAEVDAHYQKLERVRDALEEIDNLTINNLPQAVANIEREYVNKIIGDFLNDRQ